MTAGAVKAGRLSISSLLELSFLSLVSTRVYRCKALDDGVGTSDTCSSPPLGIFAYYIIWAGPFKKVSDILFVNNDR